MIAYSEVVGGAVPATNLKVAKMSLYGSVRFPSKRSVDATRPALGSTNFWGSGDAKAKLAALREAREAEVKAKASKR